MKMKDDYPRENPTYRTRMEQLRVSFSSHPHRIRKNWGSITHVSHDIPQFNFDESNLSLADITYMDTSTYMYLDTDIEIYRYTSISISVSR